MNYMSPSPSNTRWRPTPEQRMILEELYRRGLKSPDATEIQWITGHMSLYGRVQGKNVFYWFQNRKARDKQKLRKRLAAMQMRLHLLYAQSQRANDDVIRYFHAQGCSSTPSGVCDWLLNGSPGRCDHPTVITTDGVGSTSSGGDHGRPLKTLQLFPLTAATKNEI